MTRYYKDSTLTGYHFHFHIIHINIQQSTLCTSPNINISMIFCMLPVTEWADAGLYWIPAFRNSPCWKWRFNIQYQLTATTHMHILKNLMHISYLTVHISQQFISHFMNPLCRVGAQHFKIHDNIAITFYIPLNFHTI